MSYMAHSVLEKKKDCVRIKKCHWKDIQKDSQSLPLEKRSEVFWEEVFLFIVYDFVEFEDQSKNVGSLKRLNTIIERRAQHIEWTKP